MNLPTHIVAAGGIVFNEKQEVLLVLNPRKGWEFPGGIIENGETVPQGLLREIEEESGIVAKVVNFVGMYSNTQKKKGYNGVEEIPTIVNLDFICEYVSGSFATSEESDAVAWVPIEKAMSMINSRQMYRFKKAIAYKEGITVSGFHIGEDKCIAVDEQYTFDR